MKRSFNNGITLIELMIAASILSIVMTVVVHMIRQGSNTMDASVWYRRNLTQLQLGLTRITDDLHRASNDRVYVVDPATSFETIKETPFPFKYIKGDRIGIIIDPDTDAIKKELVISGGGDEENPYERVVFQFLINHLGSKRNDSDDPTYSMLVSAYLKGGELYYEKKWYGSPPVTDVGEYQIPKKRIMKNIDYIYISHQNIPSEFDPSVVDGSVVRIMIKLRDFNINEKRSKLRTISVKKSIHIQVESKMVNSL